MDGLAAKRVFIALAKRLSYSSVRRCNCDHYYKLELLSPSGNASTILGVQTDETFLQSHKTFPWAQELLFKSRKWAEMLQELEGKIIIAKSERIKVNSIEQLIVDLELQGFLKKV